MGVKKGGEGSFRGAGQVNEDIRRGEVTVTETSRLRTFRKKGKR